MEPSNPLRSGVSLVVALLGGWLTVPCALLVRFELTGFGGDRDAGPSLPVVVAYVGLTAACLAGSLLVARWLAPHLLGRAVVAYAVGVVLGVLMLGIFA